MRRQRKKRYQSFGFNANLFVFCFNDNRDNRDNALNEAAKKNRYQRIVSIVSIVV